jgi:hypothetical protein
LGPQSGRRIGIGHQHLDFLFVGKNLVLAFESLPVKTQGVTPGDRRDNAQEQQRDSCPLKALPGFAGLPFFVHQNYFVSRRRITIALDKVLFE